MDPEKLYYAYPVSKTALNAATVLLANALEREGIRMNAYCPIVATQLSRMQGESPAEGAPFVVSVAKMSVDGPTGDFFDKTGSIGW